MAKGHKSVLLGRFLLYVAISVIKYIINIHNQYTQIAADSDEKKILW